jgi:hypothetical protein
MDDIDKLNKIKYSIYKSWDVTHLMYSNILTWVSSKGRDIQQMLLSLK